MTRYLKGGQGTKEIVREPPQGMHDEPGKVVWDKKGGKRVLNQVSISGEKGQNELGAPGGGNN